jgi:hypothetical protein
MTGFKTLPSGNSIRAVTSLIGRPELVGGHHDGPLVGWDRAKRDGENPHRCRRALSGVDILRLSPFELPRPPAAIVLLDPKRPVGDNRRDHGFDE